MQTKEVRTMAKPRTWALVALLGAASVPAMSGDLPALGSLDSQFQKGILTIDKQIGGKSADLIHKPNGFTDLNAQGEDGSGVLHINPNGLLRTRGSIGDKTVKVIRTPDGVGTLLIRNGDKARKTTFTPPAQAQALNGAVTDKVMDLHTVAHNRLGMFAEGSAFDTQVVKVK